MFDALSPRQKTLWITFALLVGALALRAASIHGGVADSWMNFSPLMAIVFAGSLLLPKSWPVWGWVALLLAVDLICRGTAVFTYGGGHWEIVACYACYGLAAFAGKTMQGRVGLLGGVVGALACSVVFYLVSNTVAWAIEPYYAKSAAGWIQALTTGVPGPWPSTLAFFRNSLIADLSGVLAIFAVAHLEASARGWRLVKFKAQAA